MSPRQGEKGEKTLLSNNVGKKSVNDAGPKQGHDKVLAAGLLPKARQAKFR